MRIFEYNNFSLSLNMPEILLVPEFRAIIEHDKSKAKDKAFRMFTYAYLLLDFRSPFKDYTEEERMEEAKKAANVNKVLVESEEMQGLLKKYEEILMSNKLLAIVRDMYISIDQFREYFRTVNFHEKIEAGPNKGKLLHQPSDLLKVYKEMRNLFDTVKMLEQQIKEELSEDSSVRGDQEMGWIMGQ